VSKFAISEYEKLDEGLRFGGKAISREVLRRLENDTRKKTGDEEKALAFRPDKKQDATIFLLCKMLAFIGAAVEHIDITISTTEDGSITGLSIDNPTRGSVDTHGNIGIGQDNSSEVPG